MIYMILLFRIEKKKNIEEEQKELKDNKSESNFISFNDVIIQNHYVGIRSGEIEISPE